MANVKRDNNQVPCIAGVLNTDGATITPIKADPITHSLDIEDGSETETKGPGTMTNHSYSLVPWSDVNNAMVSNNSYATVTCINQNCDGLEATNFSFSIPSTAVISGIITYLEAKTNSGTVQLNLTLLKGGAVVGSSRSMSVTTTETTLGSNGVLWNTTWTPAEINDSGFGLSIRSAGGGFNDTIFVDYISIAVSYGYISSNSNAKRDDNGVPAIMAVSNSGGITPVSIYSDSNGKLLIKSK